MTYRPKVWRLAPIDTELSRSLSAKLGVEEPIAQLLINRGIKDEYEARNFLNGSLENLHDPFQMMDMGLAVDRISSAINSKEKVTIYGDYDVDGITSTALIYLVLKQLGAAVDYYVPERQSEGYGLNSAAISNLYHSGTRLLITVDCGISAVNEISEFCGTLDIIVSDHHQPPDTLPEAYALLNPKRPDCRYPDKQLAGVGVAFKLCQALGHKFGRPAQTVFKYLDLVAIGTIADIVPLTGENRLLVKEGLKQAAVTDNVGLKALFGVCGLNPGHVVEEGKIGYMVAPRLNAAGRISNAATAIELLITDDEAAAQELAQQLDQENIQRQVMEKEILAAAEELLSGTDIEQEHVLVLSGQEWHSGVIGIVASRLVEKYYRPVIIISESEGIGKGSCRSIPGFDMYEALSECSDILIRYGGHRMAAGLSIQCAKIPELRQRLHLFARQKLKDEDYMPVIDIDATVALDEIQASFLEQLACLSPYGMGNPRPTFVSRKASLESIYKIGQAGRHLKLTVRQGSSIKNVISWEMGRLADELPVKSWVDLVFIPEFNEWQGKKTIQLRAHDIKATDPVRSGKNRNAAVERVIVGQVYLILKKAAKKEPFVALTDTDISELVNEKYKTVLSAQGVSTAVKVLSELSLIKQMTCHHTRKISLLPPPAEKLNIEDSTTFREGNLSGEYSLS